jgi:hypothetical protein
MDKGNKDIKPRRQGNREIHSEGNSQDFLEAGPCMGPRLASICQNCGNDLDLDIGPPCTRFWPCSGWRNDIAAGWIGEDAASSTPTCLEPKWKAAVQTSIDASRQVNRKWLQQSGLHRAIALWSVAGIARDTPEAYVTLRFCILCQLLDIHCATNFTCYLLSAAIYAIILPGQSWCLAAATALVFPLAGRYASKFPGPEVRKQGKKDGTEANVRWRIQSIAMIKENTVLFQSHGMPPDANTHTLETEKMDTSSAEALQRRMVTILEGHTCRDDKYMQRRMVTILEGHTCRDDKYKQCYAIIQPHLSNPSELPEIVLH